MRRHESGNYRLVGATLYCTVEPCLMCLGRGAARADRDGWCSAPTDPKVGATARLEELRGVGAEFNHRFETIGGVLAEEAAALLLRVLPQSGAIDRRRNDRISADGRRGTEVVITGAPRKRLVSVRRHVGSNPTLSAIRGRRAVETVESER